MELKRGMFLVYARDYNGWPMKFIYDLHASKIYNEDGTPYDLRFNGQREAERDVDARTFMDGGKYDLRKVKIQLGLSCNYSCEYCSQRFVPHSESTTHEDIEAFLERLKPELVHHDDAKGQDLAFEFWGGEPFVYWKTLKPLAERLRSLYPFARFSIITNGSLLDAEKNDWLVRLGFSVGISHDGPGQSVRGPDPLDDPQARAAILDLFNRLHPMGRVSFNCMLNRVNTSRSELLDFFSRVTGRRDVVLGEGGMIDPYDEGGMALSPRGEELLNYRRQAIEELRADVRVMAQMPGVRGKVTAVHNALVHGHSTRSLGQKCGMDGHDVIAVDLKGNVLTCQNTSAVATNPAGVSHKIGELGSLKGIKVVSATHWSDRKDCDNCPALRACAGSCMFLSGPLWETACDTAFSDGIVAFAVAFEMLTGFLPYRIVGGRKDREYLWEHNKPAAAKSFPIRYVE